MRLLRLIGAIAIVAVVASNATAQVADSQSRAVEIPLEQIWGYNLPETHDIAGIPLPEQNEGVGKTYAFLTKDREYNIEQIRRQLASKSPKERALPSFVVPGDLDSRMLGAVRPPLNGKSNPPQRNFPEGEFTLVFFSHPLSYYARLRRVEQTGEEITVHYQFEPHTTPESTVHFALIPLGSLSAGDYHVTYKQIPIEPKYRDMGFEPVQPDAAEIVCRDFSFTVGKPPQNELPSEGALIPLKEVWGHDIPKTRDAGELDAVKSPSGISHPLIDSLTRIIFDRFKNRDKAGPAFVVEGTGKTALENTVAAFKAEPARYMSSDSDVTLVFYTRFTGFFVRLDKVEQIGQKIIVTYRFVQHASRNVTFHFALIPLGEMSPGTYEVEIKESPPIDDAGRPMTLDQDLSWAVCHGETFYVEGR